MEVLIELMCRIETHPPVKEALEAGEPVYLTDDAFLADDVEFVGMIQRWESLADDYLIDGGGAPFWENIARLEDVGYEVGPGEQDSFGWVTGKVRKKNVIYVFG